LWIVNCEKETKDRIDPKRRIYEKISDGVNCGVGVNLRPNWIKSSPIFVLLMVKEIRFFQKIGFLALA